MRENVANEKNNPNGSAIAPTRRQMIAGAAAALCTLAASSSVLAGAQQAKSQPQAPTAMPKAASGAIPDALRTSLRQEVDFKATPEHIYEILLGSKLFTAVTGQPAEISREAGGVFSMFAGVIVGRNIELVPNVRIVQAWRPAYWPPGVYSLVKFELRKDGAQTKIVLDHTGFPEGDFASLGEGWGSHYWTPLTKFLA